MFSIGVIINIYLQNFNLYSLDTEKQYQEAITKARNIFVDKTKDYGTAWRILRTSSLTDQLYIKAKRIRSIQEKGNQKVEDAVDLDFVGLVNYAIMALIQLELGDGLDDHEMEPQKAAQLYDHQSNIAFKLMIDKNHDYGEAWREMRVSSITDLILMKLLRIKEIENNDGKTIISEGLDANYLDIVNYAVFALILLESKTS